MKRIITVGLCLALLLTFVGCATNEPANGNKPTESQLTTQPTETENGTNNNNEIPLDGELDLTNSEIKTKIWDKDFTNLSLTAITLDMHWDRYIKMGGVAVGALKAVDISNTPNYYYKEDPNIGALEFAYLSPVIDLQVTTNIETVSDAFNARLFTTVANYNNNVYVTNIQVLGMPNVFDENCLRSAHEKSIVGGEAFGLGNTYQQVSTIIGNYTNSWTDDMLDGSYVDTYVYVDEDAELVLLFTRMNDNKDDAVLTSFTWTPSTLRNELTTHYNTITK